MCKYRHYKRYRYYRLIVTPAALLLIFLSSTNIYSAEKKTDDDDCSTSSLPSTMDEATKDAKKSVDELEKKEKVEDSKPSTSSSSNANVNENEKNKAESSGASITGTDPNPYNMGSAGALISSAMAPTLPAGLGTAQAFNPINQNSYLPLFNSNILRMNQYMLNQWLIVPSGGFRTLTLGGWGGR